MAVARRLVEKDEVAIEARRADGSTDAIEIRAHGTATAFHDLQDGTCDVGMASRRISPKEVESLSRFGPMDSPDAENIVALDGIAVIVNRGNPIRYITKDALVKIADGEAKHWSDVGGGPATITLHVGDEVSGIFNTLKTLVLGDRPLAKGAFRYRSIDLLADAVSSDLSAIGFAGIAHLRNAKPVRVEEANAAPVFPSPAGVSTEDYPLSRRLYLYLPAGAPPIAKRLVDFALSDEGQKLVSRHGLIDLRPECDQEAAACPDCSAEIRKIVASACRLSLDMRFDASGKMLDTKAIRDVDRIGGLFASGSVHAQDVVLLGFSEAMKSRGEELAASKAHAELVAGQMRAKGIPVGVVRGFGAQQRVADDSDEPGKIRNRRVEVWLR